MTSVDSFEPNAHLRPARQDDLSAIQQLLEDSGLPMDGVADIIDTLVVADAEGEIVGVGGLELCRENALLRSVAVHQDWREHGIGRALVLRLISEAEARGLSALYLLTTSAERYFPHFGFEHTARDEVPADVRETGEFRTVCPSSATVMARQIRKR
jgi:amino-acid N-acetyltransferase